MNFEIELKGGMDCEATFFSGQAFRWNKVDDGFEGVVNGYYAKATMKSNTLCLNGDGTEQFWQSYFAQELDYTYLRKLFYSDEALRPCIEYAPGIRVLHQPFYETLCTFIISQNNNIPRIKGIVERLCEGFGDKLNNNRFAFPTAEQMASLSLNDLAPLRSGFRAKYLLDAAQKVACGDVSEYRLRAFNTETARAQLCNIFGVGPKVADCVMLYSLAKNEVIPMDVHMKRAMSLRFPNGLSSTIAPYAGIAQQYIFHHERTAKNL